MIPRTPVPAGEALDFLIRATRTDPRPMALFDTVWGRCRPKLITPHAVESMNDLAVLVLEHYRYRVLRDPRRAVNLNLVRAVRAARLPEPGGCRFCSHDRYDHGVRYTPHPGEHEWTPPTDGQRAERLRALRMDLEGAMTG